MRPPENKLIVELQRLYFLPEQQCLIQKPDANGEAAFVAQGTLTPDNLVKCLGGEGNAALNLISREGMVRTLVVSVARGKDWTQVASLYQGVQEDLDMPAPAISVSVDEGYQVWFSLAVPVSLTQAKSFLDKLRRKYLPHIPLARLKFRPGSADDVNAERVNVLPLVPALDETTGRWSAFIDPTMGSMFIEETWLEMAPARDKQAGILAGVESIKAENFQRALTILLAEAGTDESPERSVGSDGELGSQGLNGVHAQSALSVGCQFTDPKRFLLAVMNDQSASARHRIEAAKALLPYFDKVAEQ